MAQNKLQDNMDSLWIATAWRSPWRQAPYLRLQEPLIVPDFSAINRLGLSQMRTLPPEILQIIYQHSKTSPLWKYGAVTDLARSIISPPSSCVSLPLCEISAWTRGSVVETLHRDRSPILRLTIDSYGIKSIESLSSYPEHRLWRTDYFVYVVTERSNVGGVIANHHVSINSKITHKY